MFAGLLRWAETGVATRSLLGAKAAVAVTTVASALLTVRHPVLRGATLSIGPMVFGASRDACQHLVRFAIDRRWVRYATAIDDDGSVLFSTLLNDGTFRIGAPTVVASAGTSDAGASPPTDAWFVSDGAEPAQRAVTQARGASHRLATAGSGSLSG